MLFVGVSLGAILGPAVLARLQDAGGRVAAGALAYGGAELPLMLDSLLARWVEPAPLRRAAARIGERRVECGCNCDAHVYTCRMRREDNSDGPVKNRALHAIREALVRFAPGIEVDSKGYTAAFRDNLLPAVAIESFEADLRAGDGNELETKFRAAHSSSALAVNAFAPFRTQTCDLRLLNADPFDHLHFERKCPTGLRGGRAPNLDVLLTGPNGVIGIESKLTEYLGRHRAEFSPAYREQIRDERQGQGYFREMLRLMDEPDCYVWLDGAQLIKHAFGLARTFRGRPVTLLYLYWVPLNTDFSPMFDEHRRELAEFAQRVAGSTPNFKAMSYPELWTSWAEGAPDWLAKHLDDLAARYLVTI